MSISVLGGISLIFLVSGYIFYSKFIARKIGVDDTKITPAHQLRDDRDFIPTRPFYLLGQHFSAIAAAGPIVGPILACINFGWLPVILWIILGAIFIGAVHDFSALISSVRHKGSSIVEIVRINISKRAHIAFMIFIWISLIYVLTAFTDVTAQTFFGTLEELSESGEFNPHGAVAAASLMYLMLAIIMGLVVKTINPPLWLTTCVFVPLVLIIVWIGTKISNIFLLPLKTWYLFILLYCFIASLLPVWLLLQPRGYLGGFVLYLALLIGILGLFFGGFPIKQEAIKSYPGIKLGENLFPFLFVTVACGACSGFHGLVCSGTTSKQIDKESHTRPVGYGAMLLEGFVAIIALSTVLIVSSSQIKGHPAGKIYGDGLAHFLTTIIGKENFVFAATFGAMAFSTFVFDTVDVATRLGRYILQELFNSRNFLSAIIATLITVSIPLGLLLISTKDAWKTYWLLFGTSNQLLAGLTLFVISVWLKKSGKNSWFTLLPSLFMLIVTIFSLVLHITEGIKTVASHGFIISPSVVNGIISCILITIVLILITDGISKLKVVKSF
ncbi:MAG: carbon starvation protein A [Planctomycetota bacterium]